MDIIGNYKVEKMMYSIGNDFGMYTRDEIYADIENKLASGETDPHEAGQTKMLFEATVEFTEDNKVITWMKLPEGVSEEEINAAIQSGEISRVSDGYFAAEETEWKFEDGKYFYDTKIKGEVLGEKISSWAEIAFDDNGLLPYASGMILLSRC